MDLAPWQHAIHGRCVTKVSRGGGNRHLPSLLKVVVDRIITRIGSRNFISRKFDMQATLDRPPAPARNGPSISGSNGVATRSITIIVPAHNEEEGIGPLIVRLEPVLLTLNT